MSFLENIKVLFIALIVLSVTRTAQGQCNGFAKDLSGMKGTLQSPNFKNEGGQHELGKKSNCSWYFNLPIDRYLSLTVDNLALHFNDADDGGKTKCMPTYSLKINGERIGCEPPRVVNSLRRKSCMIYKNDNCGTTANCIKKRAEDRVEISYVADGSPAPLGSSTQLAGFRIQYSMSNCEETHSTDETGSTMGQTSTSSMETSRAANEYFSTVGYTMTGECGIENRPVTVATKPDDTDAVLYLKNCAIALAVLLSLSVLVNIYLLAKERLPAVCACARRGRSGQYNVNEAFDADAEAANEVEGQAGAQADAQAGSQADAQADAGQ